MTRDKYIFITASDNIPFSEIESYIGIVDSQIVVGANLFRDVFASFRDVFGGETRGYKKDIDKMKKAALLNIQNQAKEKGANAIISLKMDLDELSGGGKSMFIMNVYGSAVCLKKTFLNKINETNTKISINDIHYFNERRNIKSEIKNSDNTLINTDLTQISIHNLWDEQTSTKVFNEAMSASYDFLKPLEDNFTNISSKFIERYLDNYITEIKLPFWKVILNGLKTKNWYNYDFIYEKLKHENHIARFRALQLCSIEKNYYDSSESVILKEIGSFILNDLNMSISTEIVSKMLNKTEVYTCARCLEKVNYNQGTYCDCGANKYGIKPGKLTPSDIGQKLIDYSKSLEQASK